jgi:hypothetical protein
MQQVTVRTQPDGDVCRMLVRGLLVLPDNQRKKKCSCEEKKSFNGVPCSPKAVGKESICQAFIDFHSIQLKNRRIFMP